MAKLLITSGPTRQYLDPVRYLTNASSGAMGKALAEAAIKAGHEVVIVSGEVSLTYPPEAQLVPVITTDDLFEACQRLFVDCDGVIGAAAPCDYKPVVVEDQKIQKTGQPLRLNLVECADVIAMLGAEKRPNQWAVGFALETEDAHFRAVTKMQKKSCDLMVLNGPAAINSSENSVEILDRSGSVIARAAGLKTVVATEILKVIQTELIPSSEPPV